MLTGSLSPHKTTRTMPTAAAATGLCGGSLFCADRLHHTYKTIYHDRKQERKQNKKKRGHSTLVVSFLQISSYVQMSEPYVRRIYRNRIEYVFCFMFV